MQTPADEIHDLDPDERLEKFFHIVMLVLGDPDSSRWIEKNAVLFYAQYRDWTRAESREQVPYSDFPEKADALLQYMVWYSRQKERRLDTSDD